MKRTGKIFAILATLLLVFSILGIFAFANESAPVATATQEKKEAISEGKFLFYDASENTYTECKNSKFSTYASKLKDGDAIVLLSDLHYEGQYVSISSAGTSRIDLNGYRFSAHADESSKYFFQLKSGTNFYLYSSDKNYRSQIFVAATNKTSGAESSMGFIDQRYSNITTYVGDAFGVPTFEKVDGAWTKSGTADADGDNLEFFGAMLFTSYISGDASNPQNSTFNVNGGSYYNIQGFSSLFAIYGGVDININDANFFCTKGGSVISYNKPGDSNITVKNSYFYSTSTLFLNVKETEADAESNIKKSELKFESCRFTAPTIATVSSGSPSFENCSFSSAYYDDGINEIIKTNKKELVTIPEASFKREVVSSSGIYNGTLLESSFEVSYSTVPITYGYTTDKNAELVNVTWVTDKGVTVEKWHKNDSVYPMPPSIPSPTDTVSYDYYPEIRSTGETGDITYTLKPHINFTLKANIALYSDFVYNFYIPKDAVDTGSLNWARIDALNADGSIYEIGAQIKVADGKLLNLEVAKDVYEKHYLITQDISAFDGDREYQLVINLDNGIGGTFEHIQKFSIFDYAARVNAGNYTAEAKDLVNYTKTYIKAARNYASKDLGTLPYPTESNADLLAVIGTASLAKKATPSDAIKSVFYGMNISLDESIKFSFYLYPEFTDTVTFHYPVNTKYKSVTVSADDCVLDESTGLLRYDISMRAIDLRGRIVIDLGSTATEEDYSYRLSNYAYSILDSDDETKLLIDSLWAYSLATYNYLKVADSDSPTVTISVSGNAVTKDTYAIVATNPNGAAAKTLHDAILAKTGEDLVISATEVSGKNSIFVNLTEPNVLYDFQSYVDGDDLVIRCGLKSFIDDAMVTFVNKNINPSNSDITFKDGYLSDIYTSAIHYSDFGAMGVDMNAVKTLGSSYANPDNWYGETLEKLRENDLLTNEFLAIKAAHDHANATQRHSVYADSSAVYYIRETYFNGAVQQIKIQTPTDFGEAIFVIDDSFIPATKTTENKTLYNQRSHVFTINADGDSYTTKDSDLLAQIVAAGLNPESKSVALKPGYAAMIVPVNDQHMVYRRKGYSSWAGSAMTEVILIDADGNISPDTPVAFDYTNLSSITVYNADLAEMTVEGGTFITVVPRDDTLKYAGSGAYISRGIKINRSNTILKNVEHHVIGEYTLSEVSANNSAVCPYQGFFYAEKAANVLIKDCVLQGKRYYRIAGTYDFGAREVVGITLLDCTQRNFWVDSEGRPATEGTPGAQLGMKGNICWGIGGTNVCKNMVYENSTLSRFDAHEGLYNGKIIGSTISGLEITGSGTLLIENTTWYGASKGAAYNAILSLRADYGCTWDGDIILRNVDAYAYEDDNGYFGGSNPYTTAIIYHHYANWYYGYQSHFPNLTIDNIEYYSQRTGKLLSAEEMGAIEFAVSSINSSTTSRTVKNSFITEPDLHLDTTSRTSAVFEDVDTDGDGFVDGTKIAYDGSASESGVTDSSTKQNRNKIDPPDYLKILNNKQGYDFVSKIKYYMTKTTFFDDMEIIIGTTDANGNLTITEIITRKPIEDDLNSPLLPY